MTRATCADRRDSPSVGRVINRQKQGERQGVANMMSCVSTIGLGIAVLAFLGFQPAEAGCQLIHATHSAPSQAKAVEDS
jgi:hypothetical protein